LGGQLLLEEAQVFGLMGGDQATGGSPASAASPPLPVRVELSEACPLLALPEPVDAAHPRSRGRVLAATAIRKP